MIGFLGISYQTAPVSAREAFALGDEGAVRLIDSLRAEGLIEGGIVLSTCNRTELYYETKTECLGAVTPRVLRALVKEQGLGEVSPDWFVSLSGVGVMRHLFRLASGLESMVLGETQIVGQLKDAFRRATDHSQSTSIVSRMFHKAFETAKGIRTDYLLSSTPISAGASAVDFVCTRWGSLSDKSVLIVGAGQMAETIYERLGHYEPRAIGLYNRTASRAERFAERHGRVRLYVEDEIGDAVADSDLIFVATSALKPVITPEIVDGARGKVFFDMSVPRNISPEVEALEEIVVYTIDDLQQGEALLLSEQTYEAIDERIQTAVSAFEAWCDATQIRGVIGLIQEVSEAILERELGGLPQQLSPEERALIAEYDRHLRITYSTAIVSSLRELSEDGRELKYTEAIQRLFAHILKKEQG